MSGKDSEYRIRELARRVLECAYEVASCLGAGLREDVYQRALLRELHLQGIQVACQPGYPLVYKGELVGECNPDLVVEETLIVQLECACFFDDEQVSQCRNFLRASGLSTALLLNFQHSRLEWRKVFQYQDRQVSSIAIPVNSPTCVFSSLT